LANFVLIPGAWLGAWAWNRVVPLLEKSGHSAYPITLTGMGERVHLASKDVGVETAIQDVINVVEFNDLADFVVVGHSFAGKVAAAVADRESDKVSKLIYLDAFFPAKVRTPQGALDPSGEFGPLPEGAYSFPLTEATIGRIGSDVQGDDKKWLTSKATPWPRKLASDPITLSPEFDSVKCAYIFCTKSGDPVDEITSGKWGKLEGPFKLIDSGHWPMITRPEELAKDLISI
jgi:pimeloyl-ACP methyl ester carboxylesterase